MLTWIHSVRKTTATTTNTTTTAMVHTIMVHTIMDQTIILLPLSQNLLIGEKKGAVAYVKNQGTCGGCWSFSASGALEGLHAIKNKKLVALSEQQMIDCADSSYGNQGCGGGLMTGAFTYTEKHGLEAESGYAYTASQGTCRQNPKKVVFKNTGFKEVPANNHKALKAAVAQQPVSVGIEASGTAVQLYGGGVISSGCDTGLDHGVLVVGYDTDKQGRDYWIVKNSWGPNWGSNGYFHIAAGNQNSGAGVCGINMMASYPTLEKDSAKH